MADITGTVILPAQFGRQDEPSRVLGKIDFTAALVNTNTYTIADLFPDYKQLAVESFNLFGSVMDTNETPALAVSVGNSDDPDGFLKSTVLSFTQPNVAIRGDGDFIGSTFADNGDLTMTVTANPETGAASGTFFFEVVARDLPR